VTVPRTTLLALAPAALAACLSGCAGPPPVVTAVPIGAAVPQPRSPRDHIRVVVPPRPQTTNAVCPITGMPVKGDKLVAVHRGMRVGFCNPECLDAWNILTIAERDRLLAMAERNRVRVWRTPP